MMPNKLSRPHKTIEITRGAVKLCLDLGYTPLLEFTLKTGRRADICGMGEKGEIIIIEVKSSLEDFCADRKWHEYKEYCDEFYFAISLDFPRNNIPECSGLMICDGFGGQIIRNAPKIPLSSARRKSVIVNYARSAALKTKLLETKLLEL